MATRQRTRSPIPRFQKVTSLTAAVLAAIYGTHARADADADENGMSLQEVVVTATRRALSAQDIPISITAVTGAALEHRRHRRTSPAWRTRWRA
jgi:outer membrane receptor protein involved in Fe transport